MRRAIGFAMFSAVIVFWGCIPPDGRSGRRYAPPPRTSPGEGMRISKPYFCNGDGPFYYYFDEEIWIYFYKPTGEWFKTKKQPPCEGWTAPKAPFPGRSEGVKRETLGIVPDANGEVQPVVAYADYSPASQGNISLDDRLTLTVAAEYDWGFPFESDTGLLDSIGSENISFTFVDIEEDGKPAPVMVELRDITLRDAIKVLYGMGFTDVEGEVDGETFRAELNGTIDDYTAALIYQGDELVDTIALR